jgi:RimJ/RimL family protein N-acetyltransferase
MGADDVILRPARIDDWERFCALFDAIAGEGRWLGSELPSDWDARRPGFERSVAGEDSTLLLAVAHDGEDLVGFIRCHLESHGRAEIGMGVADGWRGVGIGRRLLDAAIAFARGAGAHKVTLEVWPHNERALRLYESAGFVVEGRLRRHWRRRDGSLWDSLAMGLVLDEDAPGSPY